MNGWIAFAVCYVLGALMCNTALRLNSIVKGTLWGCSKRNRRFVLFFLAATWPITLAIMNTSERNKQ